MFLIMVTYFSSISLCGYGMLLAGSAYATLEPVHLVAVLEPEQAHPDGHQGGEIVGREDFALDDREVNLDLVEPTGMDGCVRQGRQEGRWRLIGVR